jgi:hypothetical protein
MRIDPNAAWCYPAKQRAYDILPHPATPVPGGVQTAALRPPPVGQNMRVPVSACP